MGADTGRLVRINLDGGTQQVLAEDPEADVADVRLHPDTREPQVVMFLKDRMEYRVLDPALGPDLAAVRALHPGDPSFADHDDADETWLVAFSTDAGPVSYFGYDRRDRTAEFLFDSRPELSPGTSWPRWSRSRSPPGTAWRSTGTPRSRRAPAGGTCHGARRARRPVGPGRVGLRPGGTVAGQPRLPVRAGQLPRLDRGTARRS